jgi:hypothetical protein
VPANYVVWATGQLQNPEETLHPEILTKYKEALNSASIVSIISPEDLEKGVKTVKNSGKLTWKFKAESVPDFAFATSDHYLWDASSLVMDNGRSVLIAAAYDPESKDFYQVAEIARNVIDYLSTTMPAVPFPYPEMTVFNGGGGMEFPMMVNDASTKTLASTVHLTAHEIAHTYFPFYMGINEKKYAWMDEGWAMMLPFGIEKELAPDYQPVERTINAYEKMAGLEYELPLMAPSITMSSHTYATTYRHAAYYKPGTAYHLLHQMLGDEDFKKGLHAYMDRWNGKHPIPFDFFFTFNDVLQQDLNWFWRPWFFETGNPDLAIDSVSVQKKSASVRIRNKGQMPVPVKLTFFYSNGTTSSLEKPITVWKDGKNELELSHDLSGRLVKIELGSEQIPDSVPLNNTWSQQDNSIQESRRP